MSSLIIYNDTTELIDSISNAQSIDAKIDLFKAADLFGNKAQNAKCWLVSDIYEQLKTIPAKQRKQEKEKILTKLGNMSNRTFMVWKSVGDELKKVQDPALFDTPMTKILTSIQAPKRLTNNATTVQKIDYKQEYEKTKLKYDDLLKEFQILKKNSLNLFDKYQKLVEQHKILTGSMGG